MIADPVSYENSLTPQGYRYHVIRGSSIFSSRRDLHDCGSAHRVDRDGRSAWYIGLRVSLTLPCNDRRGAV